MVAWKNLDTLAAYDELAKVEVVKLAEVMAGESGAERVKKYSVPMGAGLAYNYAAKRVDDQVIAALANLAEEAQLAEKYEALYNGEMINTGEKRLVLHQMCRGQLGEAVVADGVDKRTFYTGEQAKITEFANQKLCRSGISDRSFRHFPCTCTSEHQRQQRTELLARMSQDRLICGIEQGYIALEHPCDTL